MNNSFGTLKNIEAVFNENLPHILSGTAVVGVVTTSIAAVKCYEKIKEISKSDMPVEEKTKLIIKAMFAPVASGLVTVTCIIGADVVNTRRYSAVLAAYAATQTEMPKVKEMLAIEDKKSTIGIDDKNAKAIECKNAHVIDSGHVYKVVDLETGYEFHSSVALLKDAEKAVEKAVTDNGSCSLEDFYNQAEYGKYDRWLPNIAEDIEWKLDSWKSNHMNLIVESQIDELGEVYLTISYDHE